MPMTYGYVPRNWPAFQRELDERGLAMEDIEKIEMRPTADAPSATTIEIVVTARSGRVHSWRQDEAAPTD
jgi:hypothetical protein